MKKSKTVNFPKKLLIASPRGFCAGVKRAIEILDNLVKKNPNQTIYCYHQIVHNTFVVKDFENRGVKFVEKLEEVPNGSILVFSSHGVSPEIRQQATNNKLTVIDATCPFVAKTHFEIKQFAKKGIKIIYIGQPGHDEVIGATGEAPNFTTVIQTIDDISKIIYKSDDGVALITQTTLSFDETEEIKKALRKKFPRLIEPIKADICKATENRQKGVKKIVEKGAKIVIVLGSKNSSNSNKLKNIAEKAGADSFLVDEIFEIDPKILSGIDCVGLTAGASLPEYKISEAIEWIRNQGTENFQEISVADENQQFKA
jgi:4-hydroxy-3-methylbut-2-en-1-yl diphosphate reductase